MRPWDTLSRRREAPVLRGWPRCTPGSSATPTTRSGGCSTTSRRRASSTTRSSCWSPTTAPPARAARTARSTRTSSSTASPTGSRRTCPFLDDLGSPQTYNHYPTGWACAFNTPFKLWKRYSNWEGGTADPMIVSWPKRITEHRHPPPVHPRRRHRPDDLRGASASSRPRSSRATRSTRSRASASPPAFDDAEAQDRQADAVLLDGRHAGDLARGLEGGRRLARRAGHVGRATRRSAGSCSTPRTTRASATTSRPSIPSKLQELIALWWARGRTLRRAAAGEPRRASRSSAPSGRSSPSRATATSTTRAAPRCPSRSRRTSATAPTRSPSRLTIDTAEAGGVLFAQGARFGGHALYIKDGKLKYVYNLVGLHEQIVESTEPVPTGPRRCSRRRSSGRATRCRPRGR